MIIYDINVRDVNSSQNDEISVFTDKYAKIRDLEERNKNQFHIFNKLAEFYKPAVFSTTSKKSFRNHNLYKSKKYLI